MGRYRKQPVEIDAIMPTWGDDAMIRDEMDAFAGSPRWQWLPGFVLQVYNDLERQWLNVPTGHWVLRGVHGEICPCDPDVFVATYEAVT
jgi:hypothetical protein